MILTHHEQALLLLRFLQQRQRKAELEPNVGFGGSAGQSAGDFAAAAYFFLEEETESRRAGCASGIK